MLATIGTELLSTNAVAGIAGVGVGVGVTVGVTVGVGVGVEVGVGVGVGNTGVYVL